MILGLWLNILIQTLTYVCWILSSMLTTSRSRPQVVVVVPATAAATTMSSCSRQSCSRGRL
uniref:Uncharacterized protein n=1 Tax=Aegilops tauschii subsp. strangulata TaxID=200361 RepID=A0A452XNB3_AEGTS